MSGLNPRQERALLHLLASPTIRGAAKAAGVGEATLHRWLLEPAFADAYRAARRRSVEHSTARLQSIAADAVATLAAVMRSPKTPASTRVAAARTVIELAQRGVDLDDLAARVAALEKP